MIDKITNLHRLGLKNRLDILTYLGRKILMLEVSERLKELYTYYVTLILSDGYLKEQTDAYFVSVHPRKLNKRMKVRRQPSSDMSVLRQVYGKKEYLPAVNAYKQNFSTNQPLNIIDAGSNIGLTALYFSDHFDHPNVICIEPEPANFSVLECNLDNPGFGELVKINGGVWSSVTRIKIVSDFRDKSDWAFRVEETSDQNDLQAFSINYLVETYGYKTIDILKIDIEGSEKEVFTGLHANLDFLNITKCLVIEIHDEFNCRQEIYDQLEKYGFVYFDTAESTVAINLRLKNT